MTGTLIFPEAIAQKVETAAAQPLEVAAVVLATHVPLANNEFRLLARAIHMVPTADYLLQNADSLSIRSTGFVPALAEAERLGAIPIWFHTHPGEKGWPNPSRADRKVDAEIADLFRLRSGSPYYGTLIVSPRLAGLAFSGKISSESGDALTINRLWRVGDAWRLQRAIDTPGPSLSPIFDRNIRAFGSAIQETLADLAIGIVGCGGTGSAVAEQLVRLGVRNLRLLDGDVLSASNVTRVYGSTAADVGRPKPDVLRNHLLRIAPDLICEAMAGRITQERMARTFADRDLIFGCTDDNAGRLVLSRMSTYFMVPVIDLGVLLSSNALGHLNGIHGRVTVLAPESACLVCRDRIDLTRAAVELRNPDERVRLADEGYAPSLGQVEPAVVAFTTAVASAAVNELLERLVGYGPSPRPSEILMRMHDREISGNRQSPRAQHYCDPNAEKIGAGITVPLLEHLWVNS